MGFLIFVTEQSVYIHQYCWREGVNIRLLTKFKSEIWHHKVTKIYRRLYGGERKLPPPPTIHTSVK